MRLRSAGALVPALFLLAVPVQAQEQDPALPSAASILDRYVAATGGQAAYDRIENQVTKFTMSRDGQALSHVTVFQTRGGLLRWIAVTGDKIDESGLSHGVAWSKTTASGEVQSAELLEEGQEHDQVLQEAVLLSDGQWRTYYPEAETVEIDTVHGRPCYVLAVMPFAGDPQALWYDQASSLLVKQVVAGPDGSDWEHKFSDYFDAGGIRMPRRTDLTIHDVTLQITVDSVEFNQTIPDSTFDLPAEIVRLLKKKSGQ